MNAIDTRALSQHLAGPDRWAPAAAVLKGGIHGGLPGGGPLILVLLLVGLGFGVSRMRSRRRAAQHDDEWGRRPPPTAPPAPAQPPGPVTLAGPPGPATLGESPGAVPNGDASAGPARTPRRAISFERPADGWAVETHGLTKRFGANAAVNGVELLVPRGVAFGYLGPNGAGKTTLIRTLLGLTRADGGTMSLLGIPVPAERSRAQARVGAIVDEPRFHPHLTGRDNLRLLAAARGGDSAWRRACWATPSC
jgi:ABC-type multidrug transport system fused ATPase/permease subunit